MKENFLTRLFKPMPELYTAEDVRRDLTSSILLYLADIQEEIERKTVPAEIERDSALLEKFGFVNTTNAKIANRVKSGVAYHNKEYDRKKTQLAFMQNVWKRFGKDAMVVRYDQFFQILEKYDMVCGSFDRYTGAVPQFALEILQQMTDFKEESDLDKSFAIQFGYFDKVRSANIDTLRKIARMPFVILEWPTHKEISNIRGYGVEERDIKNQEVSNLQKFFIAAPAADMKPLAMEIIFDVSNSRNVINAGLRMRWALGSDLWKYPATSRRRIAEAKNEAIRKEESRLQSIMEKSNIARYCKIGFIKTQPLPERKLYDPFICSLTPCGVLIHAKWGPEAEDATIKRYEQLRDAVIGKGGAV